MITFPNCKINLGLSVTEKRPDGFHNIETVFCPVKLNDVLEISIASDKKPEFNIHGMEVPGNSKDNLCLRAYNLLKRDFDIPEIKINLIKVIPMGAGLGGGSSDAAFTIKSLNNIFSLGLSDSKMINYAAEIGSDCAFFIKNKVVFAFGKGDRFNGIKLDISNYNVLIVKPDIHISTPQAYSKINLSRKHASIKEIIKLPVSDWKENLINDFEKPIFKMHPEIEGIKNKFYDLGAEYASMSGSGSAVFGLFRKKVELHNFFKGLFVWQGKILS